MCAPLADEVRDGGQTGRVLLPGANIAQLGVSQNTLQYAVVEERRGAVPGGFETGEDLHGERVTNFPHRRRVPADRGKTETAFIGQVSIV